MIPSLSGKEKSHIFPFEAVSSGLGHWVKIGESFKNNILNVLAVIFLFETYFNNFGLIFNSWKAWPRNLICFVWLGLQRIRMSGCILEGNTKIKDLFWCVKIIV